MALSRTTLLGDLTAGNFGTGNYTSTSFTPASNSLLVVGGCFVENNGTTTDSTSVFQISDSGSHTWTQQTTDIANPTAFCSLFKIWTTPITTGSSMTVSLTTSGRTAGLYGVSVVCYTGYNTSTPVGGVGHGIQTSGFTTPNPFSVTLGSAPASGDEVFGFVFADKSTTNITPGSAFTELHDLFNSNWGSMESEIRTGSTSTTVDWVDLRPGGGALFSVAGGAIVVRAAAAAGATFVPPVPRSRRPVPPRRRPPALPGLPLPQLPAPAVAAPRRAKPIVARRGRTAFVIPPQTTAVAPTYRPPLGRFRIKGLLKLVRQRGASVVPAQITVTAPAYVPPAVRTRVRGLRAARARITGLIPAQPMPPAPAGRLRLRLLRLARAQATSAPLQQAAPVAPAYVAPFVRSRRALLRLARARISFVIPPQQTAPSVPAYVAPPVRIRVRLLRLARTRISAVIPPQQTAPSAPAYVAPPARVRSRWLPAARARISSAPITQPAAPQASTVRARFRAGRWLRRGSAAAPVQQTAPLIPPYVPPAARSRQRALSARPRQRGAFLIPPQQTPAAPPPYVPPFVRGLRRGWKLFRPRAFQVPANGQAAPVVPPPVVTAPAPNGWVGLLGIIRSAREDVRQQEMRRPIACPNDGEPLRLTADGFLFCEYDLWTPEDQVVGNRWLGGDWGGLRAVLTTVRIETDRDKKRRVIACPNDGEPLMVSQDGTIYCPFDNYILRPNTSGL